MDDFLFYFGIIFCSVVVIAAIVYGLSSGYKYGKDLGKDSDVTIAINYFNSDKKAK